MAVLRDEKMDAVIFMAKRWAKFINIYKYIVGFFLAGREAKCKCFRANVVVVKEDKYADGIFTSIELIRMNEISGFAILDRQ